MAYLACFSIQCQVCECVGLGRDFSGLQSASSFCFCFMASRISFLPGPPLLYIVLCSSCAVAPFQSFGEEAKAKQVTQWIGIYFWIKLFVNTQDVSWRCNNIWRTVWILDCYWSVCWVRTKLILLAHWRFGFSLHVNHPKWKTNIAGRACMAEILPVKRFDSFISQKFVGSK